MTTLYQIKSTFFCFVPRNNFFFKLISFFFTGVEGSIFEVFPQSMNVSGLQSCSSTTDPWQPCACTYRLNLEWFPCQLKYCRGQGSNPYKCGIKSCSKGYQFDFYTHHKHLCLWDEDTQYYLRNGKHAFVRYSTTKQKFTFTSRKIFDNEIIQILLAHFIVLKATKHFVSLGNFL